MQFYRSFCFGYLWTAIMRIIAGEYKGRRIVPVKGATIRYTSDRVKESLFSILGGTVSGARFLDLYAGSGNVGIEAISRGAESVTFVDLNPVCIKTVSSNLERCGISVKHPQIILLRMGISRAMEYFRRHSMQFDIIFLDPPYGAGLLERSLQEISACNILSDDGEIVAEHDVREGIRILPDMLMMTRQEKYGTTLLSFYEHIKPMMI